jgi:hypothetical protein
MKLRNYQEQALGHDKPDRLTLYRALTSGLSMNSLIVWQRNRIWRFMANTNDINTNAAKKI